MLESLFKDGVFDNGGNKALLKQTNAAQVIYCKLIKSCSCAVSPDV